METKKPALYIMANKFNGTIYTGVTSDLFRRVTEHKEGTGSFFVEKYNCKMLVWYFFFETMPDAIHMEKLIKKSSRSRKVKLIEALNPLWNDLYKDTYHQ